MKKTLILCFLAITLVLPATGCDKMDKNDGLGHRFVNLIISSADQIVKTFKSYGSKEAAQTQTQQKELKNVSVRIPWLRTAATIGLEVADEKGFFEEAGLSVTINPGSAEASPLRKVLSKEDQFGLLEPAQIIMGMIKQNMPFEILALKAQRSPFCLMARKDKAIHELADLKGKKIGYNPLNDISYLAMLKTANLDRKDLDEVRVQFSLEPFFQDQVEVWPSFISNEPVVAKRKGVDVSLICADDIGVHLYEAALFARKDFIDKNKEVVEGFIQAWKKGWKYALDHQPEAVDILMKRTQGLDKKNELKVLEVYSSMVDTGKAKTEGLLWVDDEQIAQVLSILHALGIIDQIPDASTIVNNKFLK